MTAGPTVSVAERLANPSAKMRTKRKRPKKARKRRHQSSQYLMRSTL